MDYPELATTPIKETIFSVSYNEIVDESCFDNFLKLPEIQDAFDVKPSINQEFTLGKEGNVKVTSEKNGFHLKDDNIILHLRRGSFSFHFLNGYKNFEILFSEFERYWLLFDKITKDNLIVTNYSARYINVIETDKENQPTHLVQLYPKQATDRDIKNFQNSIQFHYRDNPDYLINAVSTKLDQGGVLLDISVSGKNMTKQNIDLKKSFEPLRDIKNKVFFDSITARALLKYMDDNKEN